MNLIMYEPNLYVNNCKFILIVIKISVLQLSPLEPFYIAEKVFPGLTVFNNISSMILVI